MRSENFRAIVDEFELAKGRESKLRGLCERADEALEPIGDYDNQTLAWVREHLTEEDRVRARAVLADLRRELEGK